MSVEVEALFTSALGLQVPWVVEDVKLDTVQRRIDFEIGCLGSVLACPACGASSQPVHDRLRRAWQPLQPQLSTIQEMIHKIATHKDKSRIIKSRGK